MEWLVNIITGSTIVVTALVALIISLLKGKKEIEDNLPNKIKSQSSLNTEITTELEKLKELVNADRVQVYDFHNGGHYANGRTALKTSCTFEVCRTSIKSNQMYLQNIPLSCISKFTDTILTNDYLEVLDLENIKSTMPATYQLKKDMGLNSFYDVILNNEFGEPVGFLAVQFVNNKYKIKNEIDIQHIMRTKYFIENKLDKMLKGKRSF